MGIPCAGFKFNGKEFNNEAEFEDYLLGEEGKKSALNELKKESKPKTEKEVENINEIKKQAQDIFKAAVDAVKITSAKYKDRIAITSKAVEEARENFRDALKNKKISAAQYKTVVNKLSTIARSTEAKLEEAVNDFSSYIDRIGEMADIRATFGAIEKSRDKARSEMSKARTFTETPDVEVFKNFLDRINPKMIPADLFQEYTDVLYTLSDTKGLSKQDGRLLVQKANNIYSKYTNDVVNNYNNISSYINNNPELEGKPLEDIVDAMDKDGFLTSEEKETILDNSDIFDMSPKKTRESKEGYDDVKKKSIFDNVISKSKDYEKRLKKYGKSNHINADDRKVVDSVIENLKKSGKKWMDTLSDRELDKVNHAIEMMNNDFITGDLNKLIDRPLDEFKKTEVIDSQFPTIRKGMSSLKDIALSARVKSFSGNIYDILSGKKQFYQNKAAFEQADRYLRHAIDQVFGTSNSVLNKLFYSKNAGNYGQHVKFVEMKEKEFINPITKVVNNFFKGDTNAMVKFYTKITFYEQQRQVNLNENSKLSNLESMVKNIPSSQNFYEKTDLNNINEELDRFNEVGLENHEEYFNKAFTGKEKQLALDYIRKADAFFQDMQQKAIATAKKEGKVLDIRDKYRPVDFVYNGISEISEEELFKQDLDKFLQPSMKSGNLKDSQGTNGGKSGMLNFTNPVKTMEGYLRSMSMNYHCQEEVIRTYRVLNKIKGDNTGKYSKEDQAFADFMIKNVDLSVNSMVSDATGVSLLPNVLEKAVTSLGYHKISGLIKGIGELSGNAVNSTIHLKSMVAGIDVLGEISKQGYDSEKIAYNLKFSQPDRIGNIIPKSDIASSNIDISAKNKSRTSLKSVSKFSNAIDKLYQKTGIKRGREKVGNIADLTFTPADKAAATSMSFGIFTTKFKKLTGKSPDWKKIQDGDVEYMDKYKDSFEESISQANSAVSELIGTKNPWEVSANSQVSLSDNVSRKLYVKVNSFLRGYGKANSTSTYISIKKAQNKEGTWGNAAKTFAIKAGSNYAYNATTKALYTGAFALIAPMLGLTLFKDKEEEEGQITRDIISGAYQTATGSSGNFGQGAFNFALSKTEDAFGQGVTREGVMRRGNTSIYSTYNPNKSNWENALNSMKVGGSYSIAESDVSRLQKDIEANDFVGVGLDLSPLLGKIPLLKDVQNIKSKIKYQSIPSIENQKEIYQSNNQGKISELENKLKNYAAATFKNKIIGVLKEKGGKKFERLFADPKYNDKVINELKIEVAKNIHVPLQKDVNKYVENAIKDVTFDYLVRTNKIDKNIQKMYQMKSEDLNADLVKRARDAKNNPEELKKVQKDLNILFKLGKVDSSVITKYETQEIKSQDK